MTTEGEIDALLVALGAAPGEPSNLRPALRQLPMWALEDLRALVAAAVAAERERCARMLEDDAVDNCGGSVAEHFCEEYGCTSLFRFAREMRDGRRVLDLAPGQVAEAYRRGEIRSGAKPGGGG